MIRINFRDPRPIYEQVRDRFHELIISGGLPVGEKLPSVRELAASLTINPNTIQRAYRELEQEGYIVSVPGKGSFAAVPQAAIEARKAELSEKLLALVKELKTLGMSGEELTILIKGVDDK